MRAAMKRYILAFLVVTFIPAAFASAGLLSSDLERYKTEVRALAAAAGNETVKTYLAACLKAAELLQGLEASDPAVVSAFGVLVGKRLDAADELTPGTSGDPAVIAEGKSYNRYLQPYRKDEYLRLSRLQEELLERKYFQTETAKNANFLEGYLNGLVGFTQADRGEVNAVLLEPRLGVSPWEAVFRLEPLLVFTDTVQPAILAALGLNFTFFPSVDRSLVPESLEENFGSKYVKKAGGRLGVGVGRVDEKAALLLGGGLQLNAVGLWGLYGPEAKRLLFGISLADLSVLKTVLPWFY